MEAGKQQARQLPEIQPAFRNLDIGQLVQGKTLTVGNLLDWQRTVIHAKTGGAPISLIPVTTTFQPPNMIKPIAPLKSTVQTGPPAGMPTSVPMIRPTSTERIAVPENKPLISNNFSGQNMTGSVLNSMIHTVTSLMQSRGEEGPVKSPTSPQNLPVVVSSKSPAILKQPLVPSSSSSSSQQVTSNVTNATDMPIASVEGTQSTSPAPSKSSLFKLSGRTLVTILPSGGGEGKSNSSHKVFGDDAFTPIDSYGAGAFEAGSPSSGDAKTTEKITSPKGPSGGRARNESTESNTNKNNNNSAHGQSVTVKQENDSGDNSTATASTSKKGKISSRGRNIKNTGYVYAEMSDYEDDDVFLHNTSKQHKSSKSKRSARQTAAATANATTTNDAGESDLEGNVEAIH